MPVDPVTGLAIASGAISAVGLIGKGIKAIKDWVKAKKVAKQRGENAPKSPVIFEDEDIKQLDNLPPEERKLVDAYVKYMQTDPEGFLGELPDIDKSGILQAISEGKTPPTGAQLGFPNSQNIVPELMRDTDFGGIEQQARQGFQQQTIPALAERFAGLGGLNSTAFKGELGRAGSNLEGQLAGLRSQYGLQRAGLLGSLNQKQQALDTNRASAIGSLGLAQQGQNFGQQQALANLGLQENQQELARRSTGLGTLPGLLGASQYSTMGQQGKPGFSDTLLGTGLSGLGLGFQGLMQQNLINQLTAMKNLNQ